MTPRGPHTLRCVLSPLLACALLAFASFAGCAVASALPPIQPVPQVDLPRFMGRWNLIATIPTAFERGAWNGVETYALKPDGTIAIVFTFNKGAADGPVKRILSTGYVHSNSGGAVWSVTVFGPFKSQYVVAWLKPDYSLMIVARDARDYTWVFSRTPQISTADWDEVQAKIRTIGYDPAKLRKVIHSAPVTTP